MESDGYLVNEYKDAVLRELHDMGKLAELKRGYGDSVTRPFPAYVVQFTLDMDLTEYEEGGLSVSDCANLMVAKADMAFQEAHPRG